MLELNVKDCRCTPRNDDCVLESDLLEVAMHKLAIRRHQSLLGNSHDPIVRIFTLNDVFEHIARKCEDWDE